MKFILGTKQKMTQAFDDNGRVYPVTAISAGPIVVTQVKTTDNDKYNAVQVGYLDQKASRLSKSLANKAYKNLQEFRLSDASAFSLGQTIDASIFAVGDKITVAGITKGKGFQGVVKRHGFGGGRRTHGQKHSEREPGSIGGAGRAGGRVAKGMKMAGRMGGDRVSVKNLEVIAVDVAANQILIKGAIPGRAGTLLEVVSTPMNSVQAK